ncbi:MAG: CPXCG motif-containing cysteine-rich protein [Thiohalocapsa sp.]
MNRDCPWCGEPLEMTIDCSAGDQDYVEDCQICCAPILVRARLVHSADGVPDVFLCREGD